MPCIIVPHRDDGRYYLGDALGGRVWRRRSAAETKAAQSEMVVRSVGFVRHAGAHVTRSGRIVLDVPCICPQSAVRRADCVYHA